MRYNATPLFGHSNYICDQIFLYNPPHGKMIYMEQQIKKMTVRSGLPKMDDAEHTFGAQNKNGG